VPHTPKPGHISKTLNARGFAYATCCTLQPLVASRCRGQGFRIVYCCPTAANPSIIPLGLFCFLQDLQEKQRADERTRTADLISLRVITQALQGCAGDCNSRIFRGVSFPCLAECCTALRSRWYQSGIRTSDSDSLTAGPMVCTRDLPRATIHRPLFPGGPVGCNIGLSRPISLPR
jgi:hypothetical protein